MKMKQALLLLGICLIAFNGCKPKRAVETPPYLNTKLSFEERTTDLVSRMTLEEKIGQMSYEAPAVDRLHIPAHNWWNECLHGVARAGLATVYPQAVGMAAMWDRNEMSTISNYISDEARAKHQKYTSQGKRGIYQGLSFWTPNINIFRDPRWGRGMETYGEDPYLTGELAVRFIEGLQGNDSKYFKLISTAKHFAVHSGPESTRHSFDVYPSDYDLHETYLPHFKKAVKVAKVYSVMCAYQRFQGEPCCGSNYLSDLLRNKWGFDGYIVSDCWAVRDFYEKTAHHVVATKPEAAAKAVKAGTDLNCGNTYPALKEAVQEKLIDESTIDVSVHRIMMARMKLGQFDPDSMVKYTQIPYSVVDSKEHQASALEAARKSIVLLKNTNNTLPLSKNIKRVAVIGPNANNVDVLLGNYNGYPSHPITPLQGIQSQLPHAIVTYAQGCALAAQLPMLEAIPSEYLFTDSTLQVNGLKAKYFEGTKLAGDAKHTQIDKMLDFVWGNKAPFSDLNPMEYSAEWSGVLVPPATGEYAIGAEAFSGCSFYFNDSLITDRTDVHHSAKEYQTMNLEKGKSYSIKIKFNQNHTERAVMRLLWDTPKPNMKQEALNLAKSSDVVILCMGLSPMLEGEEMKVKVDGFSGGDRLDIKLPAVQSQLIKEIQALGKPTVLLLLNGSALAFNWEAKNIPAIVEAWYPGQAGGTAIANVLFGDYNPAGRLPVTFYKSIDQIPAFDNYDMTGKTYRYFKGEPLYPFGYGLSYSTFSYSIVSAPSTIKAGENIPISVKIKNTSKIDGDEVAQLYVTLLHSKCKTSIRSLEGFNRLHLRAGEEKTVNFTLTPDQFAAYNNENNAVVYAGDVLLSVGGQQPNPQALKQKEVVETTVNVTGDPYYIKE